MEKLQDKDFKQAFHKEIDLKIAIPKLDLTL